MEPADKDLRSGIKGLLSRIFQLESKPDSPAKTQELADTTAELQQYPLGLVWRELATKVQRVVSAKKLDSRVRTTRAVESLPIPPRPPPSHRP